MEVKFIMVRMSLIEVDQAGKAVGERSEAMRHDVHPFRLVHHVHRRRRPEIVLVQKVELICPGFGTIPSLVRVIVVPLNVNHGDDDIGRPYVIPLIQIDRRVHTQARIWDGAGG